MPDRDKVCVRRLLSLQYEGERIDRIRFSGEAIMPRGWAGGCSLEIICDCQRGTLSAMERIFRTVAPRRADPAPVRLNLHTWSIPVAPTIEETWEAQSLREVRWGEYRVSLLTGRCQRCGALWYARPVDSLRP